LCVDSLIRNIVSPVLRLVFLSLSNVVNLMEFRTSGTVNLLLAMREGVISLRAHLAPELVWHLVADHITVLEFGNRYRAISWAPIVTIRFFGCVMMLLFDLVS